MFYKIFTLQEMHQKFGLDRRHLANLVSQRLFTRPKKLLNRRIIGWPEAEVLILIEARSKKKVRRKKGTTHQEYRELVQYLESIRT